MNFGEVSSHDVRHRRGLTLHFWLSESFRRCGGIGRQWKLLLEEIKKAAEEKERLRRLQ
jgi:hypothetical protein